MTKKKEVVKKEAAELVTTGDMGIADDISMDDCTLGRISLVQSNADLVKEGRHDLIQKFIDTNSPDEVLGTKDEPMEVILCSTVKYWVESDADTREFIGKFPAVNKNELPWEEVVNGRKIKRTYTFSYIVVLPQHLKDGLVIPFELPFRSTGLKVAEGRINTTLMRMARAAKPVASWGRTFKIGSKVESKNGNTWFAPTAELGRETTAAEQKSAMEVRQQFAKLKETLMSKDEKVEGTAKATPITSEEF